MTSALQTRGSATTHHPHVHVIAPGGGLSPDGARRIACRPGVFLPVKVLSRPFRRLFLEGLMRLHQTGKLRFFGELAGLVDPELFAAHLVPLRKTDWVVHAKPPFGGPAAVRVYLGRYTHRVAISSHRFVRADAEALAQDLRQTCPKCGGAMVVIETFTRGQTTRSRAPPWEEAA